MRESMDRTVTASVSPSNEELQERIDSSPALRGVEYLSIQSLTQMWRNLDLYTQKAVLDSGKRDLSLHG